MLSLELVGTSKAHLLNAALLLVLLRVGALRTLPPAQWDKLNATITEAMGINKEFTTTKGNTAIAPSSVLKSVNQSISLFQDNSVFSLGQNTVYPGAPVCNPADAAAIKTNAKVPCPSPPIVTAPAKAK